MELEQKGCELIFQTIWLSELVCSYDAVSGASEPYGLAVSHAAQNAIAVGANHSEGAAKSSMRPPTMLSVRRPAFSRENRV